MRSIALPLLMVAAAVPAQAASERVVTVSGPYTVTSDADVVLAAGPAAITLPVASGGGRTLTIRATTAAIIVRTTANDTIDGPVLRATTIPGGKAITLASDGRHTWWIVGRN